MDQSEFENLLVGQLHSDKEFHPRCFVDDDVQANYNFSLCWDVYTVGLRGLSEAHQNSLDAFRLEFGSFNIRDMDEGS